MSDKNDKSDKKNATIDTKYIDWVFDERMEFITALCEQRRQTTFDLDDSCNSERRQIVEELKASVKRSRKTFIVHPLLLVDLKKDSGWNKMWCDDVCENV